MHNQIHWQLTLKKDKSYYGGWWPKSRPAIFFKNINAQDDYIKSKYDPCYRLPLFQAAFHEAIVTTDRWEISHMKFKNIVKIRELLELLYGVPSIWALDMLDIKKYSKKFKKLFEFFSPLHKIIATESLTFFDWLTKDRKIQRTVFGSTVQLTVNFSSEKFEEIPAMSIQLYWLQSGKKEIYSP